MTGAGHGSGHRYYDNGDWVLVFANGNDSICPDATAGGYIWQVSKRPLTADEVRLLATRTTQWLHREHTKFLRFELPGKKPGKDAIAKFQTFESSGDR